MYRLLHKKLLVKGKNGEHREIPALKGKDIDLTKERIESAVGYEIASQEDVEQIEKLIPDQATEENQLADKNYVNDSVATNTAYFIGTFDSLEGLEAFEGTITNNDYAFIKGVDSEGNPKFERYKYNSNTENWVYEYTITNPAFSTAEWEAIKSGITPDLVEKLSESYSKSEIDDLSEITDEEIRTSLGLEG